MSLRVGIVGLPNVGKSTLFNALLKKRVALSANYPFATVEPNVGVVAVPDERLGKLADLVVRSTSEESKPTSEVSKKPPIVPAIVEFVDIAGLVKGSSTGAGLGNQFLSHIREVDAIIHVLRDFEDQNVIRAGAENPDSDKKTIETELILADLQTLEKLILNQEKVAKVGHDALEFKKIELLNKLKEKLDLGEYIGSSFFKALEGIEEKLRDWFMSLPLLTLKPVLYVYNISDQDYKSQLHDRSSYDNEMVISAKLEEELVDLSDEERVDYLKELGIEETGLERLIKKAYSLLGLISYLTAGVKEVRAWTIRRGETALRASGVIHTDFMKNFIRAQVIEYGKLIEAGSYAEAKKLGWIRTEGKDYVVKDGDVIEFLIGS